MGRHTQHWLLTAAQGELLTAQQMGTRRKCGYGEPAYSVGHFSRREDAEQELIRRGFERLYEITRRGCPEYVRYVTADQLAKLEKNKEYATARLWVVGLPSGVYRLENLIDMGVFTNGEEE